MSYISKEKLDGFHSAKSSPLAGELEVGLAGEFHYAVTSTRFFKQAAQDSESNKTLTKAILPEHLEAITEMSFEEAEKLYWYKPECMHRDLLYLAWAYNEETSPEKKEEFFRKVSYSQEEAREILKELHALFRSDTPEGQYKRGVIEKTAEILGLSWD